MEKIRDLALRSKAAYRKIASVNTTQKNKALKIISEDLCENIGNILKANAKDMEKAKSINMSEAMQDRLRLDEHRILRIAKSIEEVIMLDDPVGKIESGSSRPNGLKIVKMRVPIGVIGIIYEARPNVTVDAGVLALKSGNTCVLRGGKEAVNTNKAIVDVMRESLRKAELPEDCFILVEDVTRMSTEEMLKLNGIIDVIIPRGGAGLIRAVNDNATVPVIATGVGNCHIYVDYNADTEMALAIIDNAKTSRPSVCNAVETVLVYEDIAATFLPLLKTTLNRCRVEVRGCAKTFNILKGIRRATEDDYKTEFNDYILAIKIVANVDEAIAHIQKYSSGHSEAILTNDFQNSQKFVNEIDSAVVYVNASTRFTDGGEFGLGAEIGISTQKLHARGPMGLAELTTNKYIVTGEGQIRK